MINLELTEQEAGNLLQLVDVAVKTQGLSVAGAAIQLAAKIQMAAQANAQAATDGEDVAAQETVN